MSWADVDTRRLQPNINSMSAIIAFGSRMCLRINIQGIVGTSLHARFATDTAAIVKIYDAVVATIERRHWTYFYARSIVAMIATHNRKQTLRFRKLALFYILNPGSIDANGYVML